MKRFINYLLSSLIVWVLIFGIAELSYSKDPKVFKLGNVQMATLLVQKGLQRFADLTKERTKGEIEIQIFPSSQLGTEQEILEGVQLGTIHMFEGSTGAVGRFLPELEAFAGPYIWRDQDHMLKTVRGPVGQHLTQKLVKNYPMRILDMGWVFGRRNLTTKNTPVRKPADMKGLKIRAQPVTIYLETIKGMGGNPTPIDWKEVYMSLQTGVADGQENPFNVIYSAKLFEVQKYLMLTEHMLQNQTVLISEKVFQNLTAEQQKIILQSAIDAGNYQNDLIAKDEVESLEKLRQAGMTVIGPKEGLDREAFRKATRYVFDLFKEKWEPGFFEKIQAVK
jgi:tripartite ATP-independent transporter DctP family solute receptor